MSLHLCRDFVTQATASSPGTNMYAMAIFLHHVLRYSVVGHSNFPLKTTFEKAGTTLDQGNVLYAKMSSGQVQIPTASYLVSTVDVNRILALRSDVYPKSNSGLFRITGVSTPNNSLLIDYRAPTGSLPPNDTRLLWRIYEQETIVESSWSSGSNTPTLDLATGSSLRYGYRTWDAGTSGSLPAAASRIILQSPHTTRWQVRLCLESDYDVKSGSCQSGMTMAPGYYSSLSPMEQPGIKTLHGPLFFNSTSSLFQGMAVGLGPTMSRGNWSRGQWGITMLGDDETGTVLMVNRGLTPLTSGWAAFGIPEDDFLLPYVAPDPNAMKRLFVMGSTHAVGSLNWRSDFVTASLTSHPTVNVVVWGDNEQPVPGDLSTYADAFNQTTHFSRIAQAGTSSFGGYTEIIDVEILAGMHDAIQSPLTSSTFQFMPRRVGRFPWARLGCGKFSSPSSSYGYEPWTHSPDSATNPQWLHTEGGIFLPWDAPAIGDLAFGTSQVWPISGAFYDGEGVLSFNGNHPGYDPDLPAEGHPQHLDATRYKKTYSYYRQPVVPTRLAKG